MIHDLTESLSSERLSFYALEVLLVLLNNNLYVDSTLEKWYNNYIKKSIIEHDSQTICDNKISLQGDNDNE